MTPTEWRHRSQSRWRIVVLSDLHGDLIALKRVIADLDTMDPVDEVLVGGDLAQGGAQPEEVVDLIRARGCPAVRRNADDLLVRLADGATPEEALRPGAATHGAVPDSLVPDALRIVPRVQSTSDHLSPLASPHLRPRVSQVHTRRRQIMKHAREATSCAVGSGWIAALISQIGTAVAMTSENQPQTAPNHNTEPLSSDWKALKQWGDDVARIEPLAGGVANDVWSVRINGLRAVGRLGTRSDADLAWETELLNHLDRNGLAVPVPIPTRDGRLFADGMVVMTYVEGGPPETAADWRRVADTLRQLHRVTQGWPQRPGWRSSTDLLHAATGTRINLTAMPPEGVERCRAAWARLVGRPTCVVHGNPDSPGNVRMTTVRVALIDWDETHVDVPDLDLVLPYNAAGLDAAAHDIAAQAKAAWDAAVCWDDEYSIRRLTEVRAPY